MKILLRLAGYGWRQKWYLAGAIVTMSAATLSMMAIPALLGSAINAALESGLRSHQLLVLSGAILLVSVLRGAFSYGQTYLGEAVSQRAAYDLRNDIFRKLQSLSFGFHDRQQTGNLMSKATADVDAVRMFISMGMIRGLSIFMMLGMVGAIMFTMNWRLALVSFAFIPVVIWRAIVMSRTLRGTWMQVQSETGEMTAVLQENLAGMKIVKSFGAREFEESKFEKKALSVAQLTYVATRLLASQGSLMTFIFTTTTGAILLFGGREIVAGRLSSGAWPRLSSTWPCWPCRSG